MSELALACDMSLSGMTRLATRLETQGFLKRDQVRKRRPRLERGAHWGRPRPPAYGWPAHLASVRRHIFAHLDELDLTAPAKALDDIAR